MSAPTFEGMPKIARLNRKIIVTEKIDGTNAQIFIESVDNTTEVHTDPDPTIIATQSIDGEGRIAQVMRAGSKSRWLIPGKQDNFGFAHWVQQNSKALFGLGDGRHLGEWWGSGVQRGYGLEKGEKRFSLFNTGRWMDSLSDRLLQDEPGTELAPACCYVVPVLYKGAFDQEQINLRLYALAEAGSVAAPGFMKPEGVVVFHTAARQMFKVTIEGDASPKGAQ